MDRPGGLLKELVDKGRGWACGQADAVASQWRKALMAVENSQSGEDQATEGGGAPLGRVPMMQRVLDNPFLLLFLGVVIPTVFYLIWGIMEITQIPIAK